MKQRRNSDQCIRYT